MKESSLKKKIILGTAQLGMNYGLCKNNLYKSDKNIIQILIKFLNVMDQPK